MRRLVGLLLTVALCLGVPGAPAATAAGCQSIAADDVVSAYTRLRQAGVLVGGPATVDMGRDLPLTRAEAAVVLVAAMGRRDEGLVRPAAPPYPDLAEHWAAGAVAIAQAEGIVRGYPDGTFRPDEQVTLDGFRAMLARLLRMPNALPGNAAELLRQAGLKREFPCMPGELLTQGALYVLLDEALSVPIYRRTPGPDRPASADHGERRPMSNAEWQDLVRRLSQHRVVREQELPVDNPEGPVSRLLFAALILNGLGYVAPPSGTPFAGDLPFRDTPGTGSTRRPSFTSKGSCAATRMEPSASLRKSPSARPR
ncbi:MAG TPA: S-layer homology domain-containing protein [Symbiobacteriaceae bacterium]|nr:S-layer homology domain-containing protein [Symbiobacteriaceae bacterium]